MPPNLRLKLAQRPAAPQDFDSSSRRLATQLSAMPRPTVQSEPSPLHDAIQAYLDQQQ